jgi:hypothetical protein
MRLDRQTRALPAVILAVATSLALPVVSIAQEQLPWQGQPQPGGYGDGSYRSAETYRYQDGGYSGGNGYQDGYGAGGEAYRPETGTQYGRRDSFSGPSPEADGYGEPYAPPPPAAQYDRGYEPPPPQGPPPTRMSRGTYEQGEIITAGHKFFGSISQGLASAVEYAFKSQGRPNGYILGQDAGGAFVLGLRYGEGRLYTKDAGTHPVFWQGPSLGYDAGAEGSKTMVLVYNLRDPSEIYHRFAGVQGAAYVVGGVSIQFQKYGDVMLGVIRSGVGLRLGANVGYLKYTRTPTWNPL